MRDPRDEALIAVIRSLGFVGNSHYCSGCLNEFHADRGQHKSDCSVLHDINIDDDWWFRVTEMFQKSELET